MNVNIFKRIRQYIKNVISEMKKVSWSKPRDLFQTTVVVIVLSVIMAAFIMLCDLIFRQLLHLVLR